MATYYIRQSGNDSNAGTSAAAAWRTLAKALGASGIASGDTVYVGAGIYREQVTVNMVSATAETRIVADVDGAFTGDVGEVHWTNFIDNDLAQPGTFPLNLNGRDFLTFEKFTITAYSSVFSASVVVTSTNITLRDCTFFSYTSGANGTILSLTNAASTAFNWTFDRCRFIGYTNTGAWLQIQLTNAASGVDYDANVQFRNCLFMGGGTFAIQVLGSGTNTVSKGGGVDVSGCTFINTGIMTAGGATFLSTSIPCTVKNSLCIASSSALTAATAGQIVDSGFNRLLIYNATITSLVTLASSSRSGDFPAIFPLALGSEYLFGRLPRHPFSPIPPSQVLHYGHVAPAETVDLRNDPRPQASSFWGDSGQATSGATTSITQSTKTWGINQWKGWRVKITGGTGVGQVKTIASNTATALTISGAAPGGGLWATTPDSTSTYVIYRGSLSETGKATAGAATTLTDGGALWAVNVWGGYTIAITGGTGSGQTRTITSNTATVITVPTWTTTPSATSIYELYHPTAGNVDAPLQTVGALELHEVAEKETTIVDANGVGIRIVGPGMATFQVPVNAVSTTISIRCRYNADHGTTNKPQINLEANGEIGVTAQTVTMTAAADTWETVSFSAFTPTAKGVVTINCTSRAEKHLGIAYFDTIVVT